MHGEKPQHFTTCRIDSPIRRALDIRFGELPGEALRATWFNPRTGETAALGEYPNRGQHTFDPPGEESAGNNGVLVLESINPRT